MVSHPTEQHLRSTPGIGARAVVVLLHDGLCTGTEPATRALGHLRMVPFARSVARATRGHDVAVWLPRRAPGTDPDASWALERVRRSHPGAPVILVGHARGGRAALRLAAEPGVAGVCALAPWLEPDEPAPPPGAAAVLIAHGDRDRVSDPATSRAYAARIGATFVTVPGEGHAMLRRPLFFDRLVTGFVRSTLAPA